MLQREFQINAEAAAQMLPSGRVTVLASRTHWARTYLSRAGLLTSPKRNLHEITPLGRDLLAQNPTRIDNGELAKFAGFSDWRTSKHVDQDIAAVPFPPEVRERSETPDEAMERGYGEIHRALQVDLLERLYQMDPIRFERLILDLLKAMGYGEGSLGSHQMTRASGDGGIDGIIHEDALGLDALYVQAKRYAVDNKVGRPAIQQFIGSLTGEGATKGVFVTTSDFSKEGRDYLGRVQHRVVLINGPDLARLMVRHGVGVRVRQTYVLRSLDEEYFADPMR